MELYTGEGKRLEKQFSQSLAAVLVCGTTLNKIITIIVYKMYRPLCNMKLGFVEPLEQIRGSQTLLFTI
jgi:hypothetical protein